MQIASDKGHYLLNGCAPGFVLRKTLKQVEAVGDQITPGTNPTLTKAVKPVSQRRGDQAMGWSMGWKVNLLARLYDGDKAFHLIKADSPG